MNREELEKMLLLRNPLQRDILDPKQVYGPCMGNIFLKNMITEGNIQIGEYTYAHMDYLEGERVLRSLVPYSFGNKRLIIGKFCSIGFGVEFISPYANHQLQSFTTYPFWHIFSDQESIEPWQEEVDQKKDTVVENDVWLGRKAAIMPGVHIGNGAVIAANSVVTQDVPPYAIVGGNPSKIIRFRFSDEVIEQLLKIRWWDWEIEHIIRHHRALMRGNMEELQTIAAAFEPSFQDK